MSTNLISKVLNAPISVEQLTPHERINCIGHAMTQLPQTACPLTHHFSPGLYMREIFMPANTVIIGKVHTTEHFNILMKGVCRIFNGDGSSQELRAPMTFISKPGVQKVLVILEDMIWMTTHVTNETDIETLERTLTEPIAEPLIKLDMGQVTEQLQ